MHAGGVGSVSVFMGKAIIVKTHLNKDFEGLMLRNPLGEGMVAAFCTGQRHSSERSKPADLSVIPGTHMVEREN